jgi:hypothetical protein
MSSFEDTLKKFPELKKYWQELIKLRNINLEHSSQEEIKDTFHKYAVSQTISTCIYTKEEFNKLTFYRVRLNINEITEDLNLTRTYSYPNPIHCIENGRANLKGKSAFYCADDPLTAILESKPNNGDMGYISVWKGNANRDIQFGIYLPNGLRKENLWSTFSNEVHKFAKEQAKLLSEEKAEQLQLLNIFISEQFIFEKKPYPITSWIANNLHYGHLGVDFILYPSIVLNAHFCNMAFHPNSVDTQLKFEKILRFKVDKIFNSKMNYSIGPIGELGTTNIKWREPTNDDLMFLPNNGFTKMK